MKKIIYIIIFLLAVIAIVASVKKPATETKKKKVTFIVPFIAQIQWAPYYTAKYNDYYDQEGLNVDIQYSNKGSAGPIEQLAGNNADFILTNTDNLLIAKSKGIDIESIYLIEPQNVFFILSDKSKNITKPEDLKGKRIGLISSASSSYPNLQAILYKSGMGINDLEVVQAGTSLVPSFLEGKFDAIAAHLSQKVLIDQKGISLNVIPAADYTDISTGSIATSKKIIDSNPELVKKFLRATKKGLDNAVANPEKAVDIYINFNPDEKSNRDSVLKTWQAIIDLQHYKEGIKGTISAEDFQKAQDLLVNIGLMTNKVDINEIFTNNFVPN